MDTIINQKKNRNHCDCKDKTITGELHIAFLGQKHILSREGGVEIVVKELSTRMAALGLNVICYNRGGNYESTIEKEEPTIWKLTEYQGVKMKTVFTINKKGIAATTSSIAASIRIAFGKYDVVHFHAEGPCAMLWLPKLFGKRCIATIHGLDYKREKWKGIAKKYILFGEKVAVKYADEIIVLSKDMQEYFCQTYGRKTRFISNGVSRPANKAAGMIDKEYGLYKDSYILFLGRLVPEKGLKYLIEAFRHVDTEKKLVIAGGSSDTDTFVSELIKMGAEDERIIFTGFVQGQLLDELYSNAYVYVLPSDLEGMPLSLLEAMSYGNCCVVSDIEECRSVVLDEITGESRAAVVKRGSIEDLRRTLQQLCDDTKMVEMYRKGAADFICSKYNWDEVIEKTLELYM